VQFLIVVGFASVGIAFYLRYLAIELSQCRTVSQPRR